MKDKLDKFILIITFIAMFIVIMDMIRVGVINKKNTLMLASSVTMGYCCYRSSKILNSFKYRKKRARYR